MQIFLTTLNPGTYTFNDLGQYSVTHPVGPIALIEPNGEFSQNDIQDSADLLAAVTAGDIQLTNDAGDLLTDLADLQAADPGIFVHLTDSINEDVTGQKTFLDIMKIGDNVASPYLLSIQDQDGDGFAYIEILSDRAGSSFGGTNKGAFFGMEDNGNSLAQQEFTLYNWQGGPIVFYTAPTASAGTKRFQIENDGTLSIPSPGTANYELLVTADDDIPNKKYVDDAITTGSPPTDLSLGTITSTDVPVNSSTGNDIATLPAATASLAGIVTAAAQTIGGRKTFNDDRIIISSPTDSSTFEIGFFDDLTPSDPNSYGMRRTDGGGVFSWMNNANFPQIFFGSPTSTGEAFWDATNNRPFNINVLDTGPDDPGPVNIGIGGLRVLGSSEISPTNPLEVSRDDTVAILSFVVESDGTLTAGNTVGYETLVLADNDIPNKKYVDDEITSATTSLALDDLTDADTTTIAPVTGNSLYFDGSNWVPTENTADRVLFFQGGCIADYIDTTGLDFCNTQIGPTAGSAFYVGRRALGTIATPTAITSGTKIAGYSAAGYGDTGYYVGSEISFYATETFSDTVGGTRMQINVTPAGGQASLVALNIEDNGMLNVAGQTDYETNVLDDDDIPNKKYVDDQVGTLDTDLSAISLRQSGSLNPIPTTWTDFDWDTTDLQNDTAILEYTGTPADEIDIKEAGLYWVEWAISADDECDVRLTNGGVVVPGSFHSTGDKGDTNQILTGNEKGRAYDLSVGTLVLQIQAITTAEFTITDSATLSVVRLKGSKGAKGDKGDTGAGSSIVLQEEDVTVTGGPHDTVNFAGADFDVTDNTGGKATVTLANPFKRTWMFSVARNAANQGNQFLRRQNGTPTNLVPFVVPVACTIWAATAENQPSDLTPSWDFVVQVNGATVYTLGVPATTDHKAFASGLSIALNAGDEVTMQMLNQSAVVDYPAGTVFFVET